MNWIERYKTEVLPAIEMKVKPERVFIFGSFARGENTEDSDIDIIIVSNYFQNIPFLKRMPLLLRMVSFPKHIDYICYTPEEFENAKVHSSIIQSAVSEYEELKL